MKFRYLATLILLTHNLLTGQNESRVQEKEVFRAISKGNISVIGEFIRLNPVNGHYGPKEMTLLNQAIISKSINSINFLLQNGADPNLAGNGLTPLIHAIRRNQPAIVLRLLRSGTNPDAIMNGGTTALAYSAERGRLPFVKILVEWGADANIRNKAGFTALDLANAANHREVAQYLVKTIEQRHFFATIPPITDGPHIEWYSDSTVRMFYLKNDTVKNFPIMRCDYFVVGNDKSVAGFAGDTTVYQLFKPKLTDPWDYQNVSKVIALGDIHGNCGAFRDFLINTGVINDKLEWTFGDGHLVFLGDLFDRGDEVTESLWLIHQLDIKSRKHGGRVHMLLGNHEVMAMINDIRYISRKYQMLTNYFSKDYASFFDQRTELGQWLRTRNTIVRINDCMFAHAGLSSEVMKNNLSIERINFLLQNFLAKEPSHPNRFPDETNLILGKFGPLWYRGYIYDFQDIGKITQEEVNQLASFYGAEKLIIAHSFVDRLSALYEDKVVAIDVPVDPQGVISEALLIENGEYFRLKNDGSKELLMENQASGN